MNRDFPSWLVPLSRSLWWALRVLAVLALGLLLWWHVYPGIAVGLPALFAVALHLLRGPGDPPKRRLHPHAALVVVGDLLTVAVLFGSALLLLRGQSRLTLVVLVIVLLCAVSLRWGLPAGPGGEGSAENAREPGPRVTRSPVVVLSVCLLVLVVTTTALSALDTRPLRETVACSWLRTDQGAADWWEGNPSPPVPHDFPLDPGSDQWALAPEVEPYHENSVSREARLVGGSEKVLTLATHRGVLALDTRDGDPLWHLDTDYLRKSTVPGDRNAYSSERVHHAGSTVLVEYGAGSSQGPRFVAAFDELTGERLWCDSGSRSPVTSTYAPDRYAALTSRGETALFDSADGSVVAVLSEGAWDSWPLLDDEQRSAVSRRNRGDAEAGFEFTEDRFLIWNGTRLSAYDLGSGRELFTVADEVPEPTHEVTTPARREPAVRPRRIDGVVTADGITVVSFQGDHIGRPASARQDREYDAEGYLTAYDSTGQQLWSSSGDGVVEEGGPLYGSSLNSCPQGGGKVFDGHFLALGKNRNAQAVHAVDLRAGTVLWSHRGDNDHVSCSFGSGAIVLGHHLRTSVTAISTSGVIIDPEAEPATLVPLPGGLVLVTGAWYSQELTLTYVPISAPEAA
ncbi:outer membrane protein assembly factor BamB family protein [Nocardiopsis valliformis]|uniref:outer membrane protein assembly factor BamB family protein n=1 Tax=Nocardiopsis valliformis TaxID=239974 RepID=UPI0003470C95|nr:PQQ-binding-like beta-propeller repeat protein [Nocardiopsis valliformis]